MTTKSLPTFCFIILHSAFILSTHAQGTAFTYQGRLNAGTSPVSGIYDLQFTIYDAASSGKPQGVPLTNAATPVSNGLFSVTLDFGADVFTGANRWLEIAVRTNGGGALTTLFPRQPVTATPYAVTAGNLNGALPSVSLSGTYANAVTLNNAANSFSGNGAALTSLNAANLTGAVPSAALPSVPAGSLTGTLPDARLSANVALLAGSQAFTGAKTFGSLVVAPSGVRVDRTNVWFTGDQNHGVGYFGAGRAFAGATPDGPVLFGFSGGGLGTEQFGIERLALFWNSAGNVGIGTVAPSVKLDVSGAIRASGGVVFPDGSTQFRATDISPLTTSGLPNGSTFTVTIGGTAATLSGQYRLAHGLSSSPGGTPLSPYAYSGQILSGGTIQVRRPRTSDLTWQGWPMAGTLRTLTLLLTVPGGSTVTWSNSVHPVAINLTQSGGTLYEELELYITGGFNSPNLLNRVVSGAPSVSAPTGDLAGITLSLNASPIPNLSFFAPFASTRYTLDAANGLPTGVSYGPVVHVRANPFSNQVLYSAFITGTAGTVTITAGGGTLITPLDTMYTEYVLRLADDGLPIEEFTLAMNLF